MTSPPAACRIELAGETIELLPERALWWPAAGVLFVADLHLGKAATYRALGQPVPGGTTQENLARLDRLIERHGAARDRLPRRLPACGAGPHGHAAGGGGGLARPPRRAGLHAGARQPRQPRRRPAGRAALSRWSTSRMAGRPLRLPAITRSASDAFRAGGPSASGLHAAWPWPRQPAHALLRARGEQPILPAFGEFTGGWQVEPAPGRRFYAVGGDGVWALPGLA